MKPSKTDESIELAKYVGQRIRYFRKKKGLTQRQLGEMIGKSNNTISNYETGIISPEQDALFAITRALDCTLDDLFPPPGDNDRMLDRAATLSEKELSFEELDFLNELIKKVKSLQGDDRKRFLSNIRLAVKLFEESDE